MRDTASGPRVILSDGSDWIKEMGREDARAGKPPQSKLRHYIEGYESELKRAKGGE